MNEREIEGVVHRIKGEAISWAGICPWTQRLCFGTESGALALEPTTDEGKSEKVEVAKEAINGVAFAGDYVGFSSREEVLVTRRISSGSLVLEVLPEVHPGGAHEIIATPGGSMLAPLGIDGLLIVTARADELSIGQTRHPFVPLNLYRIVSVAEAATARIYACAARQDGLVVFQLKGDRFTAPPQIHQLRGQDIVDVASVANSEHPRATLCLGRDRRLFYFRDVLEAHEPAVLTYDGFQGTAYCLLATQGHVFVLTDHEFIRFPHLATRFLGGDEFKQPTDAWVLETDASDAYLAGNEHVLLLRDEAAISYRVDDLVQHFDQPRWNLSTPAKGQKARSRTWKQTLTPLPTTSEWTQVAMPLTGGSI
jgi:hypothetical protein